MADLTVLETDSIVCGSAKCLGRSTRQNLIESSTRGTPTGWAWICTTCNTKTLVDMPRRKWPGIPSARSTEDLPNMHY